MKLSKRAISLLLTLAILASCLPGLTLTASAASYAVWVRGTQVTDANKNDVLGDGTVRYNPTMSTLYLTDAGSLNATEGSHNSAVLYASGSLTVEVAGNSYLSSASYGVYVTGDLYLHGSGTLNAVGADTGIYVGGKLILDDDETGPTVSAEGGYYGVRAQSALLMQGTLNTQTYALNDANTQIPNAGLYVTGGKLELGSSDPRFFRNNLKLNLNGHNDQTTNTLSPAAYAVGGIVLSPWLNVTAPEDYQFSADRCQLLDGTGATALQIKTQPIENYRILLTGYYGTVECDQPGNKAFAGQRVTLSFQPEGDYGLTDLMVEDDDGEALPVTRSGEDYSFIMPAMNVGVYAVFDEWPYSAVDISPEIRHGTILADPNRTEEGETVTLTVTPDTGYALVSISAEAEDGTLLDLEEEDENIYTFEMPDGNVTVYAEFAPSGALWVCGVEVTATNYANILGNGKASFDPATDTLTLNDLSPASNLHNDAVIWTSLPSLTITGSGTVKGGGLGAEYGILAQNTDLTLSGSLTVNANARGIQAKNLTMRDGSFEVTSIAYNGYGILVSGTLTVQSSVSSLSISSGGKCLSCGEIALSWSLRILTPAGGTVQSINNAAIGNVLIKKGTPRSIVVADGILRGAVTADKTEAIPGETVTLTVTPDPGCSFSSLTVKDANNNSISVTNNRFVMPDSDVTVTASFTINQPSVSQSYDLWLGNIQVTSANCRNIRGDGQASYNPETQTLYFNNFDGVNWQNLHDECVVYTNTIEHLTIEGNGLVAVRGGNMDHSIHAPNTDVTIRGEFEIHGEDTTISAKNLIFDGGNTTVNTIFSPVVAASETVTVTNRNESINLTSMRNGVLSGDLVLDSLQSITANGYNGKYYLEIRRDADYPITLSATGGRVVASSSVGYVGHSVELTLQADDGYALDTLTVTDANGGAVPMTRIDDQAIFTMPNSAVTVNAVFRQGWLLQIATPTHGSVTAPKLSYSPGNTVELTVTADSGYELTGLTVFTASGAPLPVTNNRFTMPDCDVLVAARFQAIRYTVTVEQAENGLLTADVADALPGDLVTLTAQPALDYYLSSVTVTMEGGGTVWVSNNQFVMPAANVTVTPSFTTETFPVTIMPMEHGTVTPDKTQAPRNSIVTLTVTPDPGYALVSGSLRVTDDVDYPVALTDNQFRMPRSEARVYADFYAVDYTVTVAQSSHGTLSVDRTTAKIGQTVHLTVTPESGYVLSSLSVARVGGGKVEVSNNAFSMPGADVILHAVFVPAGQEDAAYDLWLGFTQVTAANAADIYNNGEASFDPETVTLDLNHYKGAYGSHQSGYSNFKLFTGSLNLTITGSGNLGARSGGAERGISAPNSSITLNGDFRITTEYECVDCYRFYIVGGTFSCYSSSSIGRAVAARAGARVVIENGTEWARFQANATANWTVIYPSLTIGDDLIETNPQTGVVLISRRTDFAIRFAPMEHGSASADVPRANAGDVVTLSFAPETGYAPDTITVTDADGNDVPVENGQFIMPAVAVTVAVEFVLADYTVQIVPTEHGSVTASQTVAHYGDEITLSFHSDTGYALSSLQLDAALYTTLGAVGLTALRGSDEDNEGIHQLVDGNVNTKWGISQTQNPYVILKAAEPFRLAAYTLTTANDTATYPGRNWKNWSIYGANFDSDDAAVRDAAQWQLVSAVENDTTLQGVNLTPFDFTLTPPDTAYQYYMIVVTANKSAGNNEYTQMAELVMHGYTWTDPTEDTMTFQMPASDVTVTATFALVDYDVTVAASEHGAVTPDRETARYGDTVTLTAAPDTGYRLEAYVVTDGDGNPVPVRYGEFTMPPSAVTVTAGFVLSDYTLAILPTEHGSVVANQTIAHMGDEIVFTVTPDEGYALSKLTVFDFSYQVVYQSTGAEEYRFTMPAANLIVAASFTPSIFNVNVLPSSHGSVTAEPLNAAAGTTVTLTVTPETQYVLESLTVVDAGGSPVALDGTQFVMPASNVTVTAGFVLRDYTLAILPTEHGSVVANQTIAHMGDEIVFTVTPDEGYALSKLTVFDFSYQVVYQSTGAEEYRFTMPAANLIVAASFTPSIFNVNVLPSSHGSVTAEPLNAAAGTTVTLTVTPETQYVLESLTVVDAGGSPVALDGTQFVMPASNVYVTAGFRRAPYSVTVAETEHGTVTATPTGAEAGERVSLTITPDVGYALSALAVTDVAGNAVPVQNDQFTMPASHVTVTATFTAIDYTVTVEVSGSGTVTADKSAAHYGDTVTLTVTPAEDYRLGSLTVTDGAGNGISVTDDQFPMPASDVTVAVVFEHNHSYGEPVWTWAGDNSAATATFACLGCDHAETAAATVTVDTNLERTLYTAAVTFQGTEYTDARTVYAVWDIQVAGQSVTGENCADVLGDGTVSYDRATNTLTLNNAVVEITGNGGSAAFGIRSNDSNTIPLMVVLVGQNQIVDQNVEPEATELYGFCAYASAPGYVFTGSGSLEIRRNETDSAASFRAIHVRKALTLDGVTVELNAPGTIPTVGVDLVYSDSVLHLQNGAELSILTGSHGDSYALASNRNIKSVDVAAGCVLVARSDHSVANSNVRLTDATAALGAWVSTENDSSILTVWDGSTALSSYRYLIVPPTGHLVILNQSANGSISADKLLAEAGDVITLTATSNAGWELAGWTVTDANGSSIPVENNRFIMPDADVTVTATLIGYDYTVTLEEVQGGAVTADKTVAHAGDTVTLTLTPDSGYELVSLAVTTEGGEAVPMTNTSFVMPAANVTVRAVFAVYEEFDLWLGATRVTTRNAADIYGDGTASYDPATQTLTLNNFAGVVGGYKFDYRIRSLFTGSLNLTIVGSGNLGQRSGPTQAGITAPNSRITLNGTFTINTLYGCVDCKEFYIVGGTFSCKATEYGARAVFYRSGARVVIENGTEWARFQGNSGDQVIMPALTIGSDLVKTTPQTNVVLIKHREDFAVNLADTQHGTVSADYQRAGAGIIVTLTATPDPGWELGALTVVDADGNAVDVSSAQNFVMPASDVTVTAIFRQIHFVGNSLSLNGDIAINFYVKLYDVDPANARVEFIWGQGEDETTQTVALAALTTDTSDRYKLTVNVAAAQMTDMVTARLYDGETLLAVRAYSVAQYARYVLDASDAELLPTCQNDLTRVQNLRGLCQAMLIYGAKSQLQFEYHLEDLADQGLSYTLTEVGTLGQNSFPAGFAEACGIQYYGSSLILTSKTTYRLYFTVTDQAKLDALTVKYGAKTLTYGVRDSLIYFDIADIPAVRVFNDHTLSFGSLTVTANAGSYARQVLASTNETLKDTVKSLYAYSQAAKTFFGVG